MARFTWDAMYEQLTPIYGGLPLWQSTQDMLDAFWLSRGYADAPQGDALYAFYVAQGAVGVTLPDLENDYWDRIGPNVLVGLGAVLVLDARNSKVGEQWALNMGSGGNVLRAKYGSVARAEIRNGVGWVGPTSAGAIHSCTVPDSAVFDITNLDVRVRVASDAWSTGTYQQFAGQSWTAPNYSWFFGTGSGTGTLLFIGSNDGSANAAVSSTVTVPFTNGTFYDVRVTRIESTGLVQFFWKTADTPLDSVSGWTQLGADRTVLAGTHLFNSSGSIELCGNANVSYPVTGVVSRVIVGNTIANVLDVDFISAPHLATTFICATGQTVTVNTANAVDTNDPKFLNWTGENHIYFPGVSNNSASVPDSAALDITGDIDIVARLSLDDWTPGGSNVYSFGKRLTTGNQRSWLVEHVTSGALAIYWSVDGTSVGEFRSNSTASVPFTDGQTGWVRITVDVDNGSGGTTCRFYTSPDSPVEPTSWTQLGSDVITAGTSSIFSSSAAVTFSGWEDGGSNFQGTIKRGIIRNGIGGTTVLDVDFTKNTNQSSFVCTTGQTVTINRATSGRKTVVVTRPCWLFGTDDYMEVADNALLDFNGSDEFTFLAIARAFGSTDGALVAKKNNGSLSVGWWLRRVSATNVQTMTDNGVGPQAASGNTTNTDGTLSVFGMRRLAGQQVAFVSNNIGSNNADTKDMSTCTFSVRVGATSTGILFFDGEIFAVAVFRRALTDTEIAQIVAAFGAA